MRFSILLVGLMAVVSFARAAVAQEQAWLQIEAQPGLALAEERARAYASVFADTAGFQVGSGWYAVVLGPYTPEAAAGRLVSLKREHLIPRDSFISDGQNHRQQFWPVGQITQTPLQDAVTAADVPLVAAPGLVAPEPVVDVDETPKQARQSEAELGPDDRKGLQEALRWYGFYTATIDGAFGPGTRKSMAAWQDENGFEPTGVLTTRQRNTLLANFPADQAEFGFETVTEAESGITITLPLKLVQFDRYEPPFVHFTEKDGSGLQVILISQPGDTVALAGLYDVMQTLAVVPPQGERQRDERSFTISAKGAAVESYAYAASVNGKIKGYLVVWKPADADRMTRILPALQASFRAVGDTALDPGLVPLDDATKAGLLAGLEVRHPKISRSGFFIDASGLVLTTTEAVADCGRITIEGINDATVTFADAVSGLAVLTPDTPLAPPAVASFQLSPARVGSDVMVAGYSYGEKLPAPVLTFGSFAEGSGLKGEPGLNRLMIEVMTGDAGGPVVDQSGAVLGMLLPPSPPGAPLMPAGVAFAASASAILSQLGAAGILTGSASRDGQATPDALNAEALGMTVLVSCWE